VKVTGVDRGVEENGERQAAGSLDVFFSDRIQLFLAAIAFALLSQVNVEGHVRKASRAEIREQFARSEDAVS
jgi:hypothetical protein